MRFPFLTAKRLSIVDDLMPSRQGKLALWQVIARVIDQDSHFAVHLAGNHAVCDVLGLDAFDEENLYRNIDWLDQRQVQIKNRLFKHLHTDQTPGLYMTLPVLAWKTTTMNLTHLVIIEMARKANDKLLSGCYATSTVIFCRLKFFKAIRRISKRLPIKSAKGRI